MQSETLSKLAGKGIAALGLVILGDLLFWAGGGFGSNLGLFAAAWAVATFALMPEARRDWRSWVALGAALLLAALLGDNPGPVALILFWTALTMAVLMPRFDRFGHSGHWVARLAVHGFISIVGPWLDLFRVRSRVGGLSVAPSLLRLLPLPLIGGAVFLALFASANPLIADALLWFGTPRLDLETSARMIFWLMLLTLVWATFRPRRIEGDGEAGAEVEPSADPIPQLPGVSVASVTLALLTFNLLFAVQNGLDLAFLWSGAPLPEGMSLADYAHRGAYPLIATALLAGLFVLVALRPGSETAAVPAIRWLVVLWIAQNVLLVASSILRTIDYIEVYSLTELRIAALVWMALVALGLVLILARMLTGRSAAWLINMNTGAALGVLAACSAVDIGSVAASWNVRHAREAGGEGAQLDLCYLNQLGPSSLVSLVWLERQGGLSPAFEERLRWVRHEVLAETVHWQQDGWWTWRNDRRLRQVEAMLAGDKLPAPPPAGDTGRQCDGTPYPAPPAAEVATQPGPVNLAEAIAPAEPLTNEVAR